MPQKIENLMFATRKSFLWLLPFAFFIVGYAIASLLFAPGVVKIPNVVGLPLAQGAKLLSDQQLSLRIVDEKEDATLPPETIISQEPNAPLRVKPYHAIFVVIAKPPTKQRVPALIGLARETADELLTKQAITCHHFTIASTAPQGTVVAQYPAPNEEIKENVQIYSAGVANNTYLVPSVLGRDLSAVLAFFERHHVPTTVAYGQESKIPGIAYRVTEQRPLPGSLIALNNPPTVQLLAQATQWEPPQTPLQTTAPEAADSPFVDQ